MPDSQSSRPLSASCPGGMARQFRVQVCDQDDLSRWKLAGSFRESAIADDCAQRLIAAGEQVRVIDCRSLPTAA